MQEAAFRFGRTWPSSARRMEEDVTGPEHSWCSITRASRNTLHTTTKPASSVRNSSWFKEFHNKDRNRSSRLFDTTTSGALVATGEHTRGPPEESRAAREQMPGETRQAMQQTRYPPSERVRNLASQVVGQGAQQI